MLNDVEIIKTDLTSWEIGPYHSALPGAMKLRLNLDGEIIVSGTAETGFLHRGLEKAMELHPWQAAVTYADHLDPEGAVFGELALCQAIEELSEVQVPQRAQAIRLILSELARVSCHMGYIVRVSRAVGADTLVHYVLRDRERVLDLFELLTGARYSINFLRFGGVAADVTEGFVERILDVCELIRIRLKEYNDLLTYNHAFLKRTQGVGVLPLSEVSYWGVTGPNARASGSEFDVRKKHPYSNFGRLDFDVPIGHAGDVHERFLIRLREIAQSVEMLRDLAESVPAGEYAYGRVDQQFKVPRGEAYSRVESSRGLLACHVISNGGRYPARVHFRTPTATHLQLIPSIIIGARIEDLPVILASLDLNLAEADR